MTETTAPQESVVRLAECDERGVELANGSAFRSTTWSLVLIGVDLVVGDFKLNIQLGGRFVSTNRRPIGAIMTVDGTLTPSWVVTK